MQTGTCGALMAKDVFDRFAIASQIRALLCAYEMGRLKIYSLLVLIACITISSDRIALDTSRSEVGQSITGRSTMENHSLPERFFIQITPPTFSATNKHVNAANLDLLHSL